MSLFGDIGNFFGNIFGGDQQKKKRQDQPYQPTTIQSPANLPTLSIRGTNNATVQAPKPLTPTPTPQAPIQLGGVKAPTAPTLSFDPNQIKQANAGSEPVDNRSTIEKIGDFAGAANRAAARTLIGGGADIVNLFKDGFDQPRMATDKENFLKSIGLGENQQNGLNTNVDYNSGAAKAGSIAGGIIGGINPVTPIVEGTKMFGNTIGATLAENDLLNKGYDPAQVQAAADAYTAPSGISSTQSNLKNALNIGGGALNLALGLAGADALVPKRNPLAGIETEAVPTAAVANEADNLSAEAASLERPPTIDETPTPRDPNSPITSSPTTNKPPAITSPNRPVNIVQPPSVVLPETVGVQPPAIEGVQIPSTPPRPAVVAPTADEATAAAQKAIDDAANQAPTPPPAAETVPVESQQAIKTAAAAEQAAPVNAQAVAKAVANEAASAAPTEAIANGAQPGAVAKLGDITRNAIIDGSINTPEGISKAIADTRTAAVSEAEQAGDSLENIIRKGQKAWQESKSAGHDLTTKEASDMIKGFTPEQQAVYKNYAQEISTLRDRAGYSLEGGQQGAWYAPRQSLTDTGESAAFDPSLVNEIARNKNQASGGIEDSLLDVSSTPFEHAMQRYANAPDAASQLMVDVATHDLETGAELGVRIPDAAKAKLEDNLAAITDKRDEVLRMQNSGDTEGANELAGEIQSDINQTFNDFIDDIPGSGKTRRQAINNVKAMRGTYMQSTMQALSLSNVVNRVADQGTKLALGAEQPLIRGLSKVMGGKYADIARNAGNDVGELNTSREALTAAKNVARGTLARELSSNFKANLSLAGAGRGIVGKTIAKLDALPRALSSAGTQLGDLSTRNVRDALQLGASRPEAAGLKTVEDYEKYFGDYVNTDKFKQDLAAVQAKNNPRIGLAGSKGDNASGGRLSTGISKEVDNAIKTNAGRLGIKPNRLVTEVNDLVKGNVTGYAGVGTRIMGTTGNAAALGIPRLRQAARIAASGDPTAVAQATQMAAQSVADAIALYGSAGAAAALAGSKVVGFTGAQPKQGSSDSAYNKANNVPANQWYVNIGDKRIYFDPARPFAGPGVAADIAGGLATGKNLVTTGENAINQVYNQVGGSSLPETLGYFTDLINPSSTDHKYDSQQLQATLAPSTGILNNVANLTDNVRRAPKNFLDDIKAGIPILRASVPEAKDSLGNTISNSKQASLGSSILSVGNNTESPNSQEGDPLGSEIARLQKQFGDVMPTNSNTNATEGTNQTLAKALLSDPTYTDASDKEKASMLKSVLAGTAVKDISTSIPTEQQQALMDFKLQGKKSDAWLENNDNAYNYYNALVANGKANGTLTSKDQDINKTGSLAQKVAIAGVNKKFNVSQDIVNGYADTNKTEFNNLPDGSDAKKQLMAYDQELVKAGLPSKYQNKYGGYGSTSGGGRSKSFAFASLPSSLLGTGSGGSNSSGGSYATNAPLYKPIADLQAPQGAPIPKGRTISVKKGTLV